MRSFRPDATDGRLSKANREPGHTFACNPIPTYTGAPGKNIFYAEQADAATILDLTDPDRKVTGWKLTTVISVMEDTNQLILVQKETGKKAIFDVSRAPAVGKQPDVSDTKSLN